MDWQLILIMVLAVGTLVRILWLRRSREKQFKNGD